MTIEEAISHALEVAGEQQERADSAELIDILDGLDVESCKECATEHRQLAEWLRELKELREENKVLTSECDRLIKEKGELLNKVSDGDVLRICQLEDRLQAELDNSHCLEIELKEAKRLLKSATNVLNMFIPCDEDYNCSECIKQRRSCDYDDSFKWRYLDEALKLTGDEPNGI